MPVEEQVGAVWKWAEGTVAGMMAGMVRVMVTVVTQVWVGQGRAGPAVGGRGRHLGALATLHHAHHRLVEGRKVRRVLRGC